MILLQFKGLSRDFSSTIVQKHQFFRTQPSLWFNSQLYLTTGKTIALAVWIFVQTSASLGLSFPTCSLGCAKGLAGMECSRLTPRGPCVQKQERAGVAPGGSCLSSDLWVGSFPASCCQQRVVGFLSRVTPASSKPAAEDLPSAQAISHFSLPFWESPVPSKDSCG